MPDKIVGRYRVDCPGCGWSKAVRVDRLDRRWQCKNCKTKFYLDNQGNVVRGDRPSDPRVAPSESRGFFDLAIDRLLASWRRLPRAGRLVLAGTAVGLVGMILAQRLTRPSDGAPPDLASRARYVAEAFLARERDRIAAVCNRSTIDDLDAWLATAPVSRPGSDAAWVVSSRITSQRFESGQACVIASIRPAAQARPTESARAPATGSGGGITATSSGAIADSDDAAFQLVMIWTLEGGKTWYLDVSRSLGRPRQERE